tara:strand:+ start:355 stop:528 length:174 start_codon:yes stop_codon:yes gene_type:complete
MANVKIPVKFENKSNISNDLYVKKKPWTNSNEKPTRKEMTIDLNFEFLIENSLNSAK